MSNMPFVADKVAATGDKIVEWFLGWPLYTIIVVVVAAIIQNTITRLVRRTVRKAAASANRERLGAAKRAARTAELTDILMGERREQRAEAIGSLLRKIGRAHV